MTNFSVHGMPVVVVGAARSGVAAARLLANRGARVTLTESRDEVGPEVTALRDAGVELELGGHRDDTLRNAALVVLSPGVPPTLPVLAAARAGDVPIISEIELASRWVQGRIVAVTGTKGKSTTTVLLGRMLEAGGRIVLVGGNVGTALSSQIEQSTPDAVHVVEVSSFQLELTTTFRPSVAVFLNLYSDHLDRHADHAVYAAAKARICVNQTGEDSLVVNADDSAVLELTRNCAAQRECYAVERPLQAGVMVAGDRIVHRTKGGDRPLIPLSAVRLSGRHLLSDVLAAGAAANLLGVSGEEMTAAVEAFHGLEHALEAVGEVDGVRFVNDSKATNVEAAARAVESCQAPLVVIMGGRFKGGDLGRLTVLLGRHADAVVVIGEARRQLKDAFGTVVRVLERESLPAAVQTAYGVAPPGGTVLLAPACASLDMFPDYAERGRVFKQAVDRLREERATTREQ
ncbi:MAG: UDP-N-acetylmuramoyl-L-alanine--D-glutamate ligase [Acidobacteria bacterium]|nr:UDP-N-acetylmuramoyl-L-alanine--D-glutamate ligase [Acidobacteriota bacterium]